jgi:uroporphyrinogen decarboxylase
MARKMSSRERVLAAINHQQPDKVPIDLGSTPSSGISATGYYNLKKHLKITTGKTRVYDVVQQLAQPEEEILDLFQVDAIDIGRAWNTKTEDWYDYTLFNGTPVQFPQWFHPNINSVGELEAFHSDGSVIAKMPKDGYFFDQTVFPYFDNYPEDYNQLSQAMDKVLWSHLAHSPWKHAGEDDFWEQLREKTIQLRNSTDKALVAVVGCNLLEWGSFLRRLDRFLVDLLRKPKEVEKLLDALMEVHLGTLEKVCNAVGDVVDILRFGDDLGENNGPLLSPRLYRKYFKPRHAQLCKYVHDHSNMKTFLHSCGSIKPLLPDLVDAGYDIINPVQINTKDMDPHELKDSFGDKITFWGGGADTQHVLNRKTPKEVKAHVKDLLDIFAPGGGFVFNAIHNILPDVPPENIVAMFEAVNEWRY